MVQKTITRNRWLNARLFEFQIQISGYGPLPHVSTKIDPNLGSRQPCNDYFLDLFMAWACVHEQIPRIVVPKQYPPTTKNAVLKVLFFHSGNAFPFKQCHSREQSRLPGWWYSECFARDTRDRLLVPKINNIRKCNRSASMVDCGATHIWIHYGTVRCRSCIFLPTDRRDAYWEAEVWRYVVSSGFMQPFNPSLSMVHTA